MAASDEYFPKEPRGPNALDPSQLTSAVVV